MTNDLLERAHKLYDTALELLESGDKKGAIMQLTFCNGLVPNAEAYFQLAHIHLSLNELPQAYRAVTRGLELYQLGRSEDQVFQQLQQLEQQLKPALEAKEAERSQSNPDVQSTKSVSPAEYEAAAAAAVRNGQYEAAKEYYRGALADADGKREAKKAHRVRCAFGELLMNLDEFAQSEVLLKEAKQLEYSYPELLNQPGLSPLATLKNLLSRSGRLSELETLFTADAEKMLEQYGRESLQFNMSMIELAKAYWYQLQDRDKCLSAFSVPVAFARQQPDVMVKRVIFMNYKEVLRSAGMAQEADALEE